MAPSSPPRACGRSPTPNGDLPGRRLPGRAAGADGLRSGDVSVQNQFRCRGSCVTSATKRLEEMSGDMERSEWGCRAAYLNVGVWYGGPGDY